MTAARRQRQRLLPSALLLVLPVCVAASGVVQGVLRGGGRAMAFKFDFGGDGAAGAGASAGGGFKFNFGGGDDDGDAGAEPTAQEKRKFSFDDYRTTPEGMVVAREMPADYDKEEELDDMALEALFEDVVFAGRGPMKRATPPNIESLTGPLAKIVRPPPLPHLRPMRLRACAPARPCARAPVRPPYLLRRMRSRAAARVCAQVMGILPRACACIGPQLAGGQIRLGPRRVRGGVQGLGGVHRLG